MGEREKFIYKFLLENFGLELNIKQTCQLLQKSESTLKRWRDKGIGPCYKKDETSKNGAVTYPIQCLVEYVLSTNLLQKTLMNM